MPSPSCQSNDYNDQKLNFVNLSSDSDHAKLYRGSNHRHSYRRPFMPQTLEASARAHIRRESLDIYNRLRSIQADIAFVNQVRAAYPAFPLIRTAASSVLVFYPPFHLTNLVNSKPPLWSLVHRSRHRTSRASVYNASNAGE